MLHLWLVGKPVVDFMFVVLNFFAISYGWDVMNGNRSKSAFFEAGWVTLRADFTGKGASPTNHCWCQKTRVIAVSCGIKISAVHHLVLSQWIHASDGKTDRQNCDSNTVRCITCSRTVKMCNQKHHIWLISKNVQFTTPEHRVTLTRCLLKLHSEIANSSSIISPDVKQL